MKKYTLPKYDDYGCINIQELEKLYSDKQDKFIETCEKALKVLREDIKKDKMQKKALKILLNIVNRKQK